MVELTVDHTVDFLHRLEVFHVMPSVCRQLWPERRETIGCGEISR